MAPLPPSCLGSFCLGCHMAGAPSRVACIQPLLEISGLVSRQVVIESNVSQALSSILQHALHLFTRVQEPLATAQPLPLPGSDKFVALAQFAGPVVAYAGSPTCPCGRKLVRWRVLPAVFMTLATGKLHGHVLVLRCFHCNTAYAGAWCWTDVGDSSSFPDGYHHPICSLARWYAPLWFFAIPQVVWEGALLAYLLHCVACGGMSLTAATIVYQKLWLHTLQDTVYATRPKFVHKRCVVMLTWSTLKMILRSGVHFASFRLYWRPHHCATDF